MMVDQEKPLQAKCPSCGGTMVMQFKPQPDIMFMAFPRVCWQCRECGNKCI